MLGIIDLNSGEIINTISASEKIIIRSQKQQNHDKFYSEEVDFEKGKRFMKTFYSIEDVAISLKDSPTTFIILTLTFKYLEEKTNALIKGNRKLKVKDLAEEFNISLPSMSKHIKKLRELNIIAEMEEYKIGRCMHLNPYIVTRSSKIFQRTIDLFNK